MRGRTSGGGFRSVGFQRRRNPGCLEFIAPDSLVRSISEGLPDPIPSLAEAETRNKRAKSDLDLHTSTDEPRKTLCALDTPDAPLFLGQLTSDASYRVRVDKHTCLPTTSSFDRASKTNPLTDAQQFCMWKGKGKTEPQPAHPRGGRRTVPTSDPQPEQQRGAHRSVTAKESRKGDMSPDSSPRRGGRRS